MTRNAFVRRLVLNRIRDGYENVDQPILRDVSTDGVRCGLKIERREIVDALARLVADGLTKAYLLSSMEARATEIDGVPAIDVIEEHFKTYFSIAREGTDLQRSDESWYPFDADDNLRPDWRLDAERS